MSAGSRASVRASVDAAVARRVAELVAQLPPLTDETTRQAVAIFASVGPRKPAQDKPGASEAA